MSERLEAALLVAQHCRGGTRDPRIARTRNPEGLHSTGPDVTLVRRQVHRHITAAEVRTLSLPMRFNFPNDPLAEEMYAEELTNAVIHHYLRTDEFDRHEIFTSAEQYERFVGLPLSGVNRRFQHDVRAQVGAEYPFHH